MCMYIYIALVCDRYMYINVCMHMCLYNYDELYVCYSIYVYYVEEGNTTPRS